MCLQRILGDNVSLIVPISYNVGRMQELEAKCYLFLSNRLCLQLLPMINNELPSISYVNRVPSINDINKKKSFNDSSFLRFAVNSSEI